MSDVPRNPLKRTMPPKLVIPSEAELPREPEATPRTFRFKPTEFERANTPSDNTPGNTPIDVKQHFRRAAAPKSPAAGLTQAKAENEVHAMLRANLAKAEAKGLNAVRAQPRRTSRRTRDYWLLLIGGNLLVIGLLCVMSKNVMTLAFGFSAMVFCSLALTWIMWGVLDDY
ncbi:MAG: hypothetical protein ABI222_07655 [Opitutaceae bacterium]